MLETQRREDRKEGFFCCFVMILEEGFRIITEPSPSGGITDEWDGCLLDRIVEII